MREREKKRVYMCLESVCVCVCEREIESVYVCLRVCV